MKPTGKTILVAAVVLVVAAVVIAGIGLIGSPAQERQRQLDSERLQNLQAIARATNLYWTRQERRLPPSLAELARQPGSKLKIFDPETQEVYSYRILTADKYELCATFSLDSDGENVYYNEFWSHGPGRQCFQLKVQEIKW